LIKGEVFLFLSVKLTYRGEIRVAQDFFGQHIAQYSFHGHGMTANLPIGEKGAGAAPFTIFQAGGIGIMFSPEFQGELGEGNSVGLLRISLGFLNLPNQA